MTTETTVAPSQRQAGVRICSDWVGQQWQQGSTSDLNLRSDDPNDGDNVVRVQWDACEFLNGGESVSIPGSKSTDEPPESTVHLYASSTSGSVQIFTTTDLDDVLLGWGKMLLDSVETVADGSTGSNVGTTGGDGPGTLK